MVAFRRNKLVRVCRGFKSASVISRWFAGGIRGRITFPSSPSPVARPGNSSAGRRGWRYLTPQVRTAPYVRGMMVQALIRRRHGKLGRPGRQRRYELLASSGSAAPTRLGGRRSAPGFRYTHTPNTLTGRCPSGGDLSKRMWFRRFFMAAPLRHLIAHSAADRL
jgi:hypothetical protein